MKKIIAFWFLFWFAGAGLSWCTGFLFFIAGKSARWGLQGEMFCMAVLIISAVIVGGYGLYRYGDALGNRKDIF